MTLGVDYAGGRPRPAAIAAAGYAFCVRYLSPGGTALPGKLLTAVEYKALTAAGIAVAVNWETTATRMKDGYPAGVADAQAAVSAIRVIGYPPDRPIYFSADWDATPADQAEIDDYLRGAASVVGPDRVGVYGGYWVVKRCLDNMTARWAWQASAWSPTNPDGTRQVDPRAHLFQHVAAAVVDGVECDVNEALKPDYGQHPNTNATPGKDLTMTAYRLDPTPIPTGAKDTAVPDGTWDAVEDTLTAPGPAGGWRGRILQHLTFGFRGGFIQEVWSAPSGRHFVNRYDPATKTGGQFVDGFVTQHYELPPGDIALIVRYATRARGSVTPEVEH